MWWSQEVVHSRVIWDVAVYVVGALRKRTGETEVRSQPVWGVRGGFVEELPFDPRWGWGDLGMWVWQFQVGVRLSEALEALVRSLIACMSLMWPPGPPAPPLCPVLLELEGCLHLSPPGPGRCELDGRQLGWAGSVCPQGRALPQQSWQEATSLQACCELWMFLECGAFSRLEHLDPTHCQFQEVLGLEWSRPCLSSGQSSL